jgi:hypothetical protein
MSGTAASAAAAAIASMMQQQQQQLGPLQTGLHSMGLPGPPLPVASAAAAAAAPAQHQQLLAHAQATVARPPPTMPAVAPTAIPPQLLDRVASKARIRAVAKLFDADIELEEGAVEVRARDGRWAARAH